MMKERGIDVDHSTLNRWVLKFSPQLESEFQKLKRRPGGRVRFDETYFLVKGQWKYINNIIEQNYRFVKRKMNHTMGFETFSSAARTISGAIILRPVSF